METFKNDQKEYDVMKSAFGISRAIKRRPFKAEHILPPGMERTLMTIAKNDGASSGELCEILDVRPSSLSEIADKMAQRGLVEKKDAAEDRRVTRICLTELGKATADQIEKSRNDAISALTACFTEDEAKQFCILADKLAAHLLLSAVPVTADTVPADPKAPESTAMQGTLCPCPADRGITGISSDKPGAY